MAEAFPISGSIDPASFPYLLVNLHQHGATGSLKVEGPSHQKALYFRGGRILFGSSNDPRDQLGAILIDAGRLDATQFQEVSARVGPGNPLAKVLADSGLVNQRDLGDAAKVKVERILADVLGYTSGAFEFEDDVLPKGAIDLKLSTERLFAAAIQRVEDPAFTTRHLGGPQAVLRQTGRDGGRLTELAADFAGLPAQFDGQRTLAESAHLAGVEQEVAARLACTLLFLGWAERAEPALPPMFDEADDTTALDFGQAAPAEAAGPQEDEPFFLPDFAAQAAPPIDAAPAEAELSVFALPADDAGDTPTLRFNVDSPTVPDSAAPTTRLILDPAAPPVPAATPPAPANAPAPPPAAAPVAPEAAVASAPRLPVARQREDLPLVQPPARRTAATRASASRTPQTEEPELATRPGTPGPSKSDLEALDTLLNSRGLEAPLKGSVSGGDSGPQPVRRPTWEPSFGRGPAPNRGARGARPHRPLPLVIGALVLVGVLGLAAAWWFWLRPQPRSARSGVPTPASTPMAQPSPTYTPELPVASPLATPAPVASASAPAVQPTPASARSVGSPSPAAARGSGGGLGEARALLQRGDLPGASRAFAAQLASAPGGSHSIQLLVACAPETITKALANANTEELYVLPVRYQKRDCYRLCWGLYASRAQAESARRGVPAYFTSGGATPKVLSAPELRP